MAQRLSKRSYCISSSYFGYWLCYLLNRITFQKMNEENTMLLIGGLIAVIQIGVLWCLALKEK